MCASVVVGAGVGAGRVEPHTEPTQPMSPTTPQSALPVNLNSGRPNRRGPEARSVAYDAWPGRCPTLWHGSRSTPLRAEPTRAAQVQSRQHRHKYSGTRRRGRRGEVALLEARVLPGPKRAGEDGDGGDALLHRGHVEKVAAVERHRRRHRPARVPLTHASMRQITVMRPVASLHSAGRTATGERGSLFAGTDGWVAGQAGS